MKKYIATPYNSKKNKIITPLQYNDLLNKYLLNKNVLNENDNILYQSHSGNLLEHSQWSALHIIHWKLENNDLMNDVHLNTAIISAFFHDIGKAGDCHKTCEGNYCWLDMYNENKYQGKGDMTHPEYSGDIILGKHKFKLTCDNCNNKDKCNLNISKLIKELDSSVNICHVALAAYMHWEFGKINTFTDESSYLQMIINYIKTFMDYCEQLNLHPEEKLLKLCIVVSCADISSGRNIRVSYLNPMDEVYLGKDPWVMYGMDKRYCTYRNDVLNIFNIIIENKVNTRNIEILNKFVKTYLKNIIIGKFK